MSSNPNNEGQRPDTAIAVKIETLVQRIVREEIAKRQPADVAAVEDLVARRVRITEDGRIIARGPQGGDMVGKSAGYLMELPEFLDHLSAENPEMFKPNAPPQPNPFKKGPHFNMTKAFALLRSDRDLALKFAVEAGIDLGVSR